MRNKILIIATIIISSNFYSQNQYQQGFNEGFKNGYCHGIVVGCIAPMAPIAPVDLTMNYQNGYNNGFVTGQRANTTNQSMGGAYGQLNPVQSTPIVISQDYYDPELLRRQKEEYAKQREENNRWKNETLITVNSEFSETNKMINELNIKLNNVYSQDEIKKILASFRKENSKLFSKYINRPDKFDEFYSSTILLRKKIENFKF